jgi:hypothetical protein
VHNRSCIYRAAVACCRPATIAGALVIFACFTSCARRADTPQSGRSSGTKVHQLRADIDRQTDKIAKTLSPTARQAIQTSLSRFYRWVAGYCGVSESLKDASDGDLSCVENHYGNFLAHVPQSVYPMGSWAIYETSAYGLLWADGDLLDQDPARPFTWDLEVIWPHVDATPNPLSRKMILALKDKVHSLVSGWAVGGWEVSVSVNIDAINACYESVGIHQFVYAGGAHGNGDFQSFNWNRMSDAPLNLADLFKPGVDWQHNIVTLYEKHLRSGSGGVPPASILDEDFLERWIAQDTVVTDHGLQIVVGGLPPAYGLVLAGVEVPWAELQPWLAPSAQCTSAGTWPASP